jgi:hypothetical protein
MNFRSFYGLMVLILCLTLGFLPVFSVGAQTTGSQLGFNDLPAPRALHFPQSSTSKATMGTISGDGDYFMSALDWGSIKDMKSSLILAGVDEYGLSVGYAQRAGKFYLGASYSGSLIDELFRRVTNQDVLTLRKKDTVRGDSRATSLLDQDGKSLPGETVSNNDINLILGTGAFGLRFGFAEWIQAVEISSDTPWVKEKAFESSLKPSLELGFNFKAGPLRIKPGLRAAFDIHEYSSNTGIVETTDAANPFVGTPGTYWMIHEKLINFYEPSAGFTLGLDFANSETASAELILDGDAAFRLYRSEDDPDSIRSTWWWTDTSGGGTPPDFPANITGAAANYDASIPLDIRITSAPRFVYTGDIGQRLTLGAKMEIGVGFGLITVEQKSKKGVDYSASITNFSVEPDFSIGASFHLIPDHFSLHAGLGLMLFSFQKTTTENSINNADSEETQKTMTLPSARFAAGLTFNFTETVAMDLMAITSGISVDATKFTLLLTVKN